MLDRHSPRHPLMRGQSPGRRFETVLLDGYTPPRELREHVARQHGYAATLSAYKHSIWDHLAVRTPHFPERTAWLTRQLTRFQILRVEPTDDTHGIELGLVPDERDQDLSPPPLELQVKRFLSLDGLLLLLLLYREAQDVGHRRQAAQLREALHRLGHEWAIHYRYQGEVKDTWRFLLETRIVDWAPGFKPAADAMQRAEQQLLREYDFLARYAPTKPRTPPAQLKGRGERRWRRRVLMRACSLHYEGVLGLAQFEYRDATETYAWLTAHREQIHRHRTRAMELLIGLDELEVGAALDPLVMPTSLYDERRRPPVVDAEEHVFGGQNLFDLIPVRRG